MATRKMPIESAVEKTAPVTVENVKPKKVEPVYGIVKDCVALNVRKSPNVSSSKVGELKANDEVKILDVLDGWYKIKDGYVMSDYIRIK